MTTGMRKNPESHGEWIIRRESMVMAAMAAAGSGVSFDPVRIQKLLFLVDQECGALVKGPYFNWEPYLYGPFDKDVYEVLRELAKQGKARHESSYVDVYRLTQAGWEEGARTLRDLPGTVSKFLEECAAWMLKRSFPQILASIYQAYPEMAVNSLMPEVADQYKAAACPRQRFGFRLPSALSGAARTLDLGAVLDEFERPSNLHEDARALARDWRAVGADLGNAMSDAPLLSKAANAG